MKKTLLRFVEASGSFEEFYDLTINYLKRQKITFRKLKEIMECSDLQTFYNYHKHLNNFEGVA